MTKKKQKLNNFLKINNLKIQTRNKKFGNQIFNNSIRNGKKSSLLFIL
jgi:hypothetical protein